MAENVGAKIGSHGFEYGVKHFHNPKSGLISEVICDTLQIEKDQVLFLLKLGAIYIDNIRQSDDVIAQNNKLFRVHTKPRRHNTNHPWNQLIVFEDSDFLVLNKPAGIPSHASVDNRIDNSLHQVELARGLKLMITHRLDTLTEGLIVYGKSARFVNKFNLQIQNRQVQKKYVALAQTTTLLPTKLIHYMESSARAPKVVTDFFKEKSALCELEIEKQIINSDHSWLRINLLTGRTHQIRAQLSAVQSPLLGDVLYGSTQSWRSPGIALRACELEFLWNDKSCLFRLPEDF